MIKKILEISNLGKFSRPTFGKGNWNGSLEKTNLIFANNGTGKTTLSLLFRSLRGSDSLLGFKKSFYAAEPISIKLLDSDNKEIKYVKGKWTRHLHNIEIFDSFFVEDNVYVITLKEDLDKPDVFEILLGDESIRLRKKIEHLKIQLSKLKNRRVYLRNKKNKADSEILRNEFIARMDENSIAKNSINEEIDAIKRELIGLTENNRSHYLNRINYYLHLFNAQIQLSKLTQMTFRVIYAIEMSGYEIKKNDERAKQSLKYVLSEGDKNALALSFFLAKLDLIPDLSDYLVVVDDPMTSFDYGRRNTTISVLNMLQEKTNTFLLLTHDMSFARDFRNRIGATCQTLKIVENGYTSYFIEHDLETELLTGIFKDLSVLHSYLLNGAESDIERREVIRCIRPALEGMFRIKCFNVITKNEWLGDILSKISSADAESPFRRYKSFLNEIEELNFFSKGYHHSSPTQYDLLINDHELRNYVLRTLKVIEKI